MRNSIIRDVGRGVVPARGSPRRGRGGAPTTFSEWSAAAPVLAVSETYNFNAVGGYLLLLVCREEFLLMREQSPYLIRLLT